MGQLRQKRTRSDVELTSFLRSENRWGRTAAPVEVEAKASMMDPPSSSAGLEAVETKEDQEVGGLSSTRFTGG